MRGAGRAFCAGGDLKASFEESDLAAVIRNGQIRELEATLAQLQTARTQLEQQVTAQAVDAQDAIDRLKNFAYDAMVIDLHLPDAQAHADTDLLVGAGRAPQQGVERVDHTLSPEDFTAVGRDVGPTVATSSGEQEAAPAEDRRLTGWRLRMEIRLKAFMAMASQLTTENSSSVRCSRA